MFERFRPYAWPLGAVLAVWWTYFIGVFARIIRLTPDGILLGHTNVWSDWALHIGLARIFATKAPGDWFAYHPIFAGGKLTYPFLTNLISGLLMRMGISLELAFIVPSILFALVLLVGLYAVLTVVTKSRWLPVLVISIFFLNSGIGGWQWLQDIATNPSRDLLTYPPLEYSRYHELEWYSGNGIVGMFVPQRAYLLGMAMAVWVWFAIFSAARKESGVKRWPLVVAGLTAGLLPIAHMHSFITTVIVSAVLCVTFLPRWRMWLWYVVPAGVLSSLLFVLFLRGGIDNNHFFSFFPLWGAKSLLDWTLQWWGFWGVLLPLALVAWILLRKQFDAVERVWFGAFTFLFALAQIFLFQPVKWDNSKLFLYASLGFATLAAYGLKSLWQRSLHYKLVTVLLVIGLAGTGVLELIRLQNVPKNSYISVDREGLDMAEAMQELSGPTDIFLTATIHNHPIAVWGARSIVLGYPAWAWNFGFDYQKREQDVLELYRSEGNIRDLLAAYNVDFVVFGPAEYQITDVNEDFYRLTYPVIYESKTYRVYDVRS